MSENAGSDKAKIKIGFWGTPAVSAQILRHLLSRDSIDISFVVTRKDKPRSGRHRQVLPSPVKKIAQENDIPVLEPENLKKESTFWAKTLREYEADFYVVFAYGKIIPKEIYTIPPKDSVNLHGSLLPLLRGASPIESSLLENFKTTGWTMQKIADKMDAGDILATSLVQVNDDDTKDTLYEKMTHDLINHICGWINDYKNGNLKAVVQQEEKATYCGKIETSMGEVDFRKQALEIRNLYRAFSEKPGIYTYLNNRKIKIKIDLSIPVQNFIKSEALPGKVVKVDSVAWVQAGSKTCIPVHSFQPEGKKAMSVKDFQNGWGLDEKTVFETRTENS